MTERGRRIKPLVTAAQVASDLSVRRAYVYRLVKQGMPCVRVGKRGYLRFDRDEVRSWLARDVER